MPGSRERKGGSRQDLNFLANRAEESYSMKLDADLLYNIFEHYLFNALVENETTEEFLTVVVRDFLARLSESGTIPLGHVAAVELDLRDEVLEMLRKKTYGHYSLTEFRKAHLEKRGNPAPGPEQDPANRKVRRPS